jgi:glycosyltransferase involved in cell wall biosynthesis
MPHAHEPVTPQLSVGVPVFNGERYLAEALTALRDQDLPDIEVIVSDNASTDATPDIVRSFVDDDPRFRWGLLQGWLTP